MSERQLDKQRVRAAALEARRAMAPDAKDAQDRALVSAVLDLVRGATRIAAYAPMPGEPGGSTLPDHLSAAVETLLLPVLRPDRDLDWAHYLRGSALHASAPGGSLLREPDGPLLGVDAIATVSLVVVPALAVDRLGVRLGRGGGSFDRSLARVADGTAVVALLYEGEIYPSLPALPHDRPVTVVLTPSGRHVPPMPEFA